MRNRQNGRLYLLDFGAVKQVTAGVSLQSSMVFGTPGFASSEQMAGRQVYPSTDLYSLAVTCLYLLTGIQPADLYDTYNDRWNWRAHTQISERLGKILDRMLQPVPSQRFQEAVEVLEALNRVPDTAVSPPPPPRPPAPPAAPPPAPPTALPLLPPLSSPVLELLVGSAFTGFESGLLALAVGSILGTTLISAGLWSLILGGLIFVQSRGRLKKVHLLFLAGISLAVVLFIPALRTGFSIPAVIFLAILSGLAAFASAALLRLIHQLLSKIV
jgi:serine/threonine protein kinase